MWVGLDHLGILLADASIAMAAFLSLAVVVMLTCHQPCRRIILAQAAMLVALLMIPLVAASPMPRLDPLRWIFPAGARGVGNGLSPEARVTTQAVGGPWVLRIATLCYLGGVTLGLGWTAIGFWGIRRLERGAIEPRSETREAYLAIADVVGDRASIPSLRVSPRVRRPVLAGRFRPFILIPPELDEPGFDRDSLRLILIHELAHADRADPQMSVVASLAQSLWFFLPHVWWMRLQLRMDQEFLADQETAARVGSTAVYASRLVALAAPSGGTVPPKTAAETGLRLPGWRDGGHKTPLLQRVVMLLHAPFPVESRPPRLWAFLAPFCMIATGILSSSLTLFARTGPSSSSQVFVTAPVGHGSFRVARFEAAPRAATGGGRCIPYTMPLSLPPRFELTVEIEVPTSSLGRMWLAGYPLGGSSNGIGPHPLLPGEPSRAGSHCVHLRRDGIRAELTIDGQPIPQTRTDAESLDWLTVEPPPDHTAILRNLLVTW